MADDVPIRVLVAVGSNVEPEQNIAAALEMLALHARLTGVSTFYRTAPLNRPEQPPFLNGVVRMETHLPARALKFDVLRTIERRLGRVRTEDAFAPRTIDLDIALYGSTVIDEPGLRVPDPDIRQRPFLAIPLLELEPDLALPDTGEALASLVQPEWAFSITPAAALTEQLRAKLLL
jgi:2-amino-4-hydroxy-6-hydroxymethyldihydropteridine diphosphokinase